MRKVFLLAAAAWLMLNLVTLTSYPSPWVDEILFADPAIHLAHGQGFVSAAWFNQPNTQLFAGYTPLYSFILAGWLKLFGVTIFTVRTFGLALISASLLMIWLVLKRVGEQSARWPTVLTIAICEPVAFLQRAGRPDSICLCLLAATALVFVAKEWRWRSPMLWLLGALAVPAALQYTAYVVVLALLLQLWFRPFDRRDLFLWGSGAVSGAALLAVLFAAHHVLKVFLEVTLVSKHSSAGRILQNLILGHGEAPFVLSDLATASLRDYATPVLAICGALVWWMARREDEVLARKLSSFAVASSVLIPFAVQLLGKYPLYYTYMGAVPATIAIFSACGYLKGKIRFVQGLILTLLLIGGAGRMWWSAWQQGTQTVTNIELVSPRDTIVADYLAYYQLIGHARELFGVDYGGGKLMPNFPENQASRISKLVVRDSRFSEVVSKVGGHWQRIGDLSVIRHGSPSSIAIIDDDTRHPETEPIGVYVRTIER